VLVNQSNFQIEMSVFDGVQHSNANSFSKNLQREKLE